MAGKLTDPMRALLDEIPPTGPLVIRATDGMKRVHTAHALERRGLITRREGAVPFTWVLERCAPCKACLARTRAGLEGRCPSCANARARAADASASSTAQVSDFVKPAAVGAAEAARVSEALARQALKRTMNALEGARRESEQLAFCANALSPEAQAMTDDLVRPLVMLMHETEERLRKLGTELASKATSNLAKAHGVKL